MHFQTLRLRVEPFALDDIHDYYQIYGDPQVSRFDDFKPIDLAQAELDIRGMVEHPEVQVDVTYKIVDIQLEQVIGGLSIKREAGRCYLGYHLMPQCWGKGYATEIVQGLIQNTDPAELLVGLVDCDNAASIRVLLKCGFLQTGVTEDNEREFVFELPRGRVEQATATRACGSGG